MAVGSVMVWLSAPDHAFGAGVSLCVWVLRCDLGE
jgi:hypothetical protein